MMTANNMEKSVVQAEVEIHKGELAFRLGLLITDNPHAKKDLRHDGWKTGWFNAQDFDKYEANL